MNVSKRFLIKHFVPKPNRNSENETAPRRHFLGALVAGVGSVALGACGGGSDPDASGSALSATAKATARASDDGSAIPPASFLIDSAGGRWTVVSGVIYLDAVKAGNTHSVTLLLWLGGNIYHAGTNSQFYRWDSGVWTKCADPRKTIQAKPTQKLFYGLNGHMAYNSGIYKTTPVATQLALLKDLGVTNYRCDVAGAGMSQVLADALRGEFKNSGVAIMPVLNPRSAHWEPTSSEAEAYALGYNLGASCAAVLKGLVTHIECGNELDSVGLKIAGNGSLGTDWSPALWPSYRGVQRGMIDGVKAVDPTIQCGVNIGIPLAYRALQMLWDGVTPDGTLTGKSGAASLRWDFTSCHWYKSYYNIQAAGPKANIDVLQILQDSFGKPIWITEFGWSGAADTPESAALYLTRALTQYTSIKDRYNIESIQMYCIIDKAYGLIQADGVTKLPAYAAYKKYIAENPV